MNLINVMDMDVWDCLIVFQIICQSSKKQNRLNEINVVQCLPIISAASYSDPMSASSTELQNHSKLFASGHLTQCYFS